MFTNLHDFGLDFKCFHSNLITLSLRWLEIYFFLIWKGLIFTIPSSRFRLTVDDTIMIMAYCHNAIPMNQMRCNKGGIAQ